jgi:lipoprotein
MKRKTLLTLGKCALISMMMTACSGNEELKTLTCHVHPELTFSCESDTRAIVASFVNGSKIGIMVTDKGTTDEYGGDTRNLNICYTLQGNDNWAASYDTSLTNAQANVYGYYPYGSDCSTGKVAMTNGIDYMYTVQPSVINLQNPAAEIRLSHAMALLRFEFDSSLGTVKSVRVRNIPSYGTLDVFTGKVTASAQKTNMDILKTDVEFSEGLLVVPGNKIDVMVYTDNGNFVWKPDQVAESGKLYNIRLSAD